MGYGMPLQMEEYIDGGSIPKLKVCDLRSVGHGIFCKYLNWAEIRGVTG